MMEFDFEYRREDEIYRVSQFLRRQAAAGGSFARSGLGWSASAAFVALALAVAFDLVDAASVGATFLAVFIWLMCRRRWALQGAAGEADSPIYGRKRCRVDQAGISIESPYTRHEFRWTAIREIEDSPHHVAFYIDAARCQVIAKKSFAAADQLQSFQDELRRNATAARFVAAAAASPVSASAGWRLILLIVAFVCALLAIAQIRTRSSLAPPREAARLAIAVDHIDAAAAEVVVLGRVSNPTRKGLQVVSLGLQFFDKDDRFIDQCTVFTLGLIVRAAGTENFKAGCSVANAGSPQRGDAILATTPRNFARVEVKASRTLPTDGYSLLRQDE